MSSYYESGTHTFHPIPDAPYYVLSNDPFMSGWGPTTGKTNTVVVPCQSYEQAERVVAYVESRRDQKRIRIVGNKPRNRAHVIYSLHPKWAENADQRHNQ